MSEALPPVFVERLTAHIPADQLAEVLRSFSADKRVGARVNTLMADPDAVAAQLRADGLELERVPWCDEGLLFEPDQRAALTHHPLAESGALYVQGPSSWLAAHLLDPQPGEEILDLAAAPGGKSLHLAARMQNRGRLACVEPIKPRFFRLKANLDRAGVSIAALYRKDGRGVGRAVPERFDRVLLDAPCSSEARFRASDPTSWSHWSPRKIREQSRKQRGLLASAWAALKPGGKLLYATCSMSGDENEGAVAWLQQRVEGLHPIRIDLPGGIPHQRGWSQWGERGRSPDGPDSVRILPDRTFDALFYALLQKAS